MMRHHRRTGVVTCRKLKLKRGDRSVLFDKRILRNKSNFNPDSEGKKSEELGS